MAGDTRKKGWQFLHYVIHHEAGANYKWQAWIFPTELIREYVEKLHQDPADYRGKRCARIWGWASVPDDVLIMRGCQSAKPDEISQQAVARMRKGLGDWDKTRYVVKQDDLTLKPWPHVRIWEAETGEILSPEDVPQDVRDAMERALSGPGFSKND